MLALIATRSAGSTTNKWIGYITTIGILSAIVLLPLAGYLGKMGWQWPFIVHLIGIPFFILAYIGLDDDENSQHERTDHRAVVVPWPIFATAVATGILGCAIFYFPFHLRDINVTDPDIIAWVMMPRIALNGVAALSYGDIRTKLSVSGTVVVGFLLGAVGIVIAASGTTYQKVMLGQAVFGFANGMLIPNAFTFGALRASPERRAADMGFVRGGVVGGPLFGQMLMEPVAGLTSASGALLALFAAAVTALSLRQATRPRIA